MPDTKLRRDWIDRIFMRLEYKFPEQWKFKNKDHEELVKEMWSSGLAKCLAQEIQKALIACDRLRFPPNHIEFYHYAKGMTPLPPRRELKIRTEESKALARQNIEKILSVLPKLQKK